MTVPELSVLNVGHCCSVDTVATVTVPDTEQTCTVRLLVDTGSSVSILPDNIYSAHFSTV